MKGKTKIMSKFKRVLSVFLVLVMLVGMVPQLALTSNAIKEVIVNVNFDLNGGTTTAPHTTIAFFVNQNEYTWWANMYYGDNVAAYQQWLVPLFTNTTRYGYEFLGWKKGIGFSGCQFREPD